MKILAIYGQNNQGNTYTMARSLCRKLGVEPQEIFLPRDFHSRCTGCWNCFKHGEKFCPHVEELRPITEAIDAADLIILTSPTYCLQASSAMKGLLEHYAYRFMPHRPDEAMFSKVGVVMATTMGAGLKGTIKTMYDCLLFWGVPTIYSCGWRVMEERLDMMPEKRQKRLDRKLERLARKIKKQGKPKVGLKTKMLFNMMRVMQKKALNRTDHEYWEKKGWLDGVRPWKKS